MNVIVTVIMAGEILLKVYRVSQKNAPMFELAITPTKKALEIKVS